MGVYLGAVLSVMALGTVVGLAALAFQAGSAAGIPSENPVLKSPRWLALLISANAAAGLGALLAGARILRVSRRVCFPTPSVPARHYIGGLLLVLGTAPVADLAAHWASVVTGTAAASADIAVVAAVHSSALEFAIVLLAFAVGPAVTEELLFRGFMTAAFSRQGMLQALVWPSLLFGLYHLEVAQAVGTVLLGLAFGLLRFRTGSVLPSVVTHGAYNAVVLVTLRLGGGAEAHAPALVERLPLLAVGGLLLGCAVVLLHGGKRVRSKARPERNSSRTRAAVSRALDRALLRLAGHRQRPGRVSESAHHEQRLERLATLARELREVPPKELWPEPGHVITTTANPTLGRRSGPAELDWKSTARLVLPSAQRWYDAVPQTSRAAARVWLSGPPRRVVILVHGYAGGHFALERFTWPVRELRVSGFDVCWFVLPFHGCRARQWLRPPPFPGPHPELNVEALRQSVLDLRELTAWLHARGHPSVGVVGYSLGGYVAALTATVEDALDFVILLAPCASLASFARDSGVDRDERSGELHAALEALYERVNPLQQPSLLPAERWLVVSGDSDTVTGLPHARALASHVGARHCVIAGGHALLLRNRSAWTTIRTFLATLEPRAPSPKRNEH